MKSQYYQGLKRKPSFNEIIGYLESGQERMKYPDRTITQIFNHPYYTNLSNLSISDQLQNIDIEQLKKHEC